MIKTWFFGTWRVEIRWKRGYWRWSVGKADSAKEYTGKNKDYGLALQDALDELSSLSVRLRQDDKKEAFIFNGCKMCGNEYKSLNSEGYCSSCWTVWNS